MGDLLDPILWFNTVLIEWLCSCSRYNRTDSVDVTLAKTRSCRSEVARRGALVLYADFIVAHQHSATSQTNILNIVFI